MLNIFKMQTIGLIVTLDSFLLPIRLCSGRGFLPGQRAVSYCARTRSEHPTTAAEHQPVRARINLFAA
jgi:hypothetical protein